MSKPCRTCSTIIRDRDGHCTACRRRRIAAQALAQGAAGKLKRSFYMAQRRAAENSLPFTIRLEDLVIPEVCPVLGIPMDVPSLDQHEPGKGYTPENVRIISWRANNLKFNGTLDEFKKIVSYLTG